MSEHVEFEESMSAADLSPADWLAVIHAVSNSDLPTAQRYKLLETLGDFHASSEEAHR